MQFRFWYWGEVFLLLQFANITHVSYWWVAFFYLIDAGEYYGFIRDEKLLGHIKDDKEKEEN
jgi:hypothetical protein